MGARTLRLLISFAVVFGVFVYIASLQLNALVPVKTDEEGKLGGPIPGLTRWQTAKFKEGKELFEKNWTVAEGLGPLYNGQSCASCHGGPDTTGGAALDPDKAAITYFAKRASSSKLAKDPLKNVIGKVEFKDEDYMRNEGGPLLVKNSISNEFKDQLALAKDCKFDPLSAPPKSAEFRSKRLAPALYGLGLVNSVTDPTFDFLSNQQLQDPKSPIRGKPVHLAPYLWGWSGTGRFGLKCQEPTLFTMAGSELNNELGISNVVAKQINTPTGPDKVPDCLKALCAAEPNDKSNILNKIHFYLNTLSAAPSEDRTVGGEQGEILFNQINCASCHVASLQTSDKVMILNPDADPWQTTEAPAGQGSHGPTINMKAEPKYVEVRALENKLLHPYSDFLLHDMGAGLADGIAQTTASGSEWRTAPLWGLKYKKFYLHDGRAKTLQDAILMHGGTAAKAAEAYKKLSDREKQSILTFLHEI